MNAMLRTASGRVIDVANPRVTDIRIEDIAKGLATQTRFCGQLKPGIWHYSIAQHCVIMSRVVAPEYALQALLHDAPEAYIHDVTRNFKRALGEAYAGYEQVMAEAITEAFGVDVVTLSEAVKVADRRMYATEALQLQANAQVGYEPYDMQIVPVTAFEAYELFQRRWEQLTGETF